MNINNNNPINKIQNLAFRADNKEKEMNLVQNSIAELINMIELGALPEYGKYTPISSSFQNDDKKLNVSNIKLSIDPSLLIEERPKEREINIKVHSNSKAYSYSVTLFRGSAKEILEQLNNAELSEKITAFIQEASSKFNECD